MPDVLDGHYGLGRKQHTDLNDLKYMWSSSPFAIGTTDRKFRFWNDSGLWLNQGETEECVEFSLHHYLADGPVTQGHRGQMLWTPGEPYKWMQENDEFAETPPEGGTSVRAGAKWAQLNGYLKNYWWAMTVEEMITHILEVGPVQVGTLWARSMWYPDSKGVIAIDGDWVGGHAYEINGVNLSVRKNEGGMFRIKQSYGRDHGNHGHIYVPVDPWRPLLEQHDGECMIGEEVKKSV